MATETLKPSRVILTGGAGFIGRRIAAKLSASGAHVHSIDCLFTGISPPVNYGLVNFHNFDIRNEEALDQLFAEIMPDIVIHLAAVHHIPTCEKDPILTFDTNVTGTQTLLQIMEKYQINKIVIASSGAVYDWADAELVENISTLRAHDTYSITKLTNENQLRIWAKKNNAIGIAARIFNTIGHDDPNGHLIPDILRQIDISRPTNIVRLGNTLPRRDYIHADDVAEAFCQLVKNIDRVKDFDCFNVCTGVEHSVRDLVATMAKLLDTKIEIEVDAARFRKIDRLHQKGSTKKLTEFTGWSATLNFEAAVSRTLDGASI